MKILTEVPDIFTERFVSLLSVSATVQLKTEVDLEATAVDNDIVKLALDEDGQPIVSNLTLINSIQIRNRRVSPVKHVLAEVRFIHHVSMGPSV